MKKENQYIKMIFQILLRRLNEDDDKLIIAPENKNFTDNEIRLLTDFQEMYYKSEIIR